LLPPESSRSDGSAIREEGFNGRAPVRFAIASALDTMRAGLNGLGGYRFWTTVTLRLGVQLRRPYRQAWHDALPRLLEQERDITIWEPMRSDRKQL